MVHWIEPSTLERYSKALACRCMIGFHSYDNIAKCIDKVLNEFNIQNKKPSLLQTMLRIS